MASLVIAETDLLHGVLRQHVSIATSAPSPIVGSVNNIPTIFMIVLEYSHIHNSTVILTTLYNFRYCSCPIHHSDHSGWNN